MCSKAGTLEQPVLLGFTSMTAPTITNAYREVYCAFIDKQSTGTGYFIITAVSPPAPRLRRYAYACERESVCMCAYVPNYLIYYPSNPSTHTNQCAPWYTVVQARKNVLDNVHVQYYITADTEKT